MRGLITGSGVNADSAVSRFLNGLASSSISGEETATASYAEKGKWDGTLLDYAFPKHISWKTSGGTSFQSHAHHVWPRYLGGVGVSTLQVRQGLHIAFHRIEGGSVPGALGLTGRSKTAAKAAYDAAVLAGTGTAWVNSVRGALASAYASFQTANVATGNFQSAATGILGGVGAASLTF